MQNSQNADLNVRVIDNATKDARSIGEKMELFLGGAAKNIGTSFKQMFDVTGAGFKLVGEEGERLQEALGNSFVSINEAGRAFHASGYCVRMSVPNTKLMGTGKKGGCHEKMDARCDAGDWHFDRLVNRQPTPRQCEKHRN